jgi:hypothetical protein
MRSGSCCRCAEAPRDLVVERPDVERPALGPVVLRRSERFAIVSTLEVTGVDLDPAGHTLKECDQHQTTRPVEATMAGMIRKLLVSGVAAKLIQEAQKPQNQAKIKKAIADFQNKRGGGSGRGGTTRY